MCFYICVFVNMCLSQSIHPLLETENVWLCVLSRNWVRVRYVCLCVCVCVCVCVCALTRGRRAVKESNLLKSLQGLRHGLQQTAWEDPAVQVCVCMSVSVC